MCLPFTLSRSSIFLLSLFSTLSFPIPFSFRPPSCPDSLAPSFCLTLASSLASAHQGWVISQYDNEGTGQYVPVSHSIQLPLYNMSLLKTRFLSPDDDNSHDPMLLQLSEPVNIAES